MAIMPIRIARVQSGSQIVDTNGFPASAFLRTINDSLGQIEDALNGIVAAQAAAEAAQATADAAQDQAIAAATAAAGAALEAATATTTAAAAQAAADSKINQATADGLYVHQDGTPTWAPASGTASRSSYATYVAPTVSNPPSTSEVQGIANATQTLSQHLKAAIDDLVTINAFKS